MAVSVEQKRLIAEIALTILCIILLACTLGRMNRIISYFSTLISWSCYSLAFYVMGISMSPHPSDEGSMDDDRSASLACSAILFVGLANSIVCRSIPGAYQNLCESYLVQMVFVLVLIISPWSIVSPLRFGLLLAALLLLWVAQHRSRLLSVSARSRIKDDLLISKYMAKKRCENQDSENEDQSPADISGCKYYIVGGEVCSTTYWALQRVLLKHLTNFGKGLRERAGKNTPVFLGLGAFFYDLQYASTPGAMASPVIRYDNLVSVKDIWKHIPPSQRSPSWRSIGRKILDGRDLCLSFALFKLLRQRFRGGNNPHESDFPLQGLLSVPLEATSRPNPPSNSETESFTRVFNIIDAELGFLFDFFYGNHLPDSCYLRSTFGFTVWTSSLYSVYYFLDNDKLDALKPPHKFANDATIFLLISWLGLWEFIRGAFSPWQKINLLVYICQRRKRSSLSQGSILGRVSDRILLGVLKLIPIGIFGATTRTPSSHRARQYCLLLHDDSPRSTTSKIPIKVKEYLINALLDALHKRKGILSDGRSFLSRNGEYEQLSWACCHECVAEKIIVWHNATTLCNVGYAVPTTTRTDEDHEVATMLSGYCAYLVAFVPELIADDIYATRLIFDNACAAASERVKGEGSLAKMCESAKKMTFGGSGTDFTAVTKLDAVFQGKMLAAQLLNLEDNVRWRVLAEVWAELMLFISPGDNAAAHLEKLKNGGEFITHIWALLKHAGIPERSSGQNYLTTQGNKRSQLIERDDIEFSISASDLQEVEELV